MSALAQVDETLVGILASPHLAAAPNIPVRDAACSHEPGPSRSRIDRVATIAFNMFVAIPALIFFLPLLAVVALTIAVSDPGPVLFRQRRVGLNGKSFACLKFRTMVTDAEERLNHLLATDEAASAEWSRDHKLRNDPRITTIGRFLRRSSIDELPQLFNVLRGEMAIVGPRPIVPSEVARYGRYFESYCRVTPGLTGLWQVSGRNNVSYRRRVAFDVTYVRSRSLLKDIQILLRTVPAVLRASGSY